MFQAKENRFAPNMSYDSISRPNRNDGNIRASISPPNPSMVMVSPTATLLPVDAEPFADERPFILELEDLTELAFFSGGAGTAAVSAGALRLRSSTMIGYMIGRRDGVESKGKTDGLSQGRRKKGRKLDEVYSTTRADGRGQVELRLALLLWDYYGRTLSDHLPPPVGPYSRSRMLDPCHSCVRHRRRSIRSEMGGNF